MALSAEKPLASKIMIVEGDFANTVIEPYLDKNRFKYLCRVVWRTRENVGAVLFGLEITPVDLKQDRAIQNALANLRPN